MKELELYIHIPFCVRKCKYCDFLSAPAERQVQNAYMDALLREARGRAEELLRTREERTVTSVFLGGGTPSIVAPERIAGLMETLRTCFTFAPAAEITMEMNPGTVTEEGLGIYRQAGVNRLSIGCQSTKDSELELLGRVHDFNQFLESYRMARKAGFDNINVDLMGALPGQTREDNANNIREILRLDPVPEHISAYSLIMEEGTPFYEMHAAGRLALPDEETERDMYWDAAELLQAAGYVHYEISNYARPGFACRHNCGYWRRTEYLGFGIGAASLLNNVRYVNDSTLEKYLDQPLNCRVEQQKLSCKDVMEETMFLGLRMMEGINGEEFCRQFGKSMEDVYGEVIRKGIREGLLEYRGGRLSLTPWGIDLSNYIMAEFLL